MKAGINGVPQLSILDGWWLEVYNGKNGWAFWGSEGLDRDAGDAKMLYDILEKDIVPLYYDTDEEGVPHRWITMMKATIKQTGSHFSTRRMAKEYVNKFYRKAIESTMKSQHEWPRLG